GRWAVYENDVAAGALALHDATIRGGGAARGSTGVPGQDAPSLDATMAMKGTAGTGAGQSSDLCDDQTSGMGGAAGTNGAIVDTTANGGVGGAGGTQDTHCFLNPFASDGDPGANAKLTPPPAFGHGGVGGEGHPACTSGASGRAGGAGGDGGPGRVTNGPAGTVGTGGVVTAGFWLGGGGLPGGPGGNGTGGGGGGGSGG